MLEILQALQPILLEAITGIFVIISGIVGAQINAFFKQRKLGEKMSNHKELIGHVVKAVEQGYKDFDGSHKLEIAKDKAVELANQKGLKITDAEMDMLIEACVAELKKEAMKQEIIVKEEKKETLKDFNY